MREICVSSKQWKATASWTFSWCFQKFYYSHSIVKIYFNIKVLCCNLNSWEFDKIIFYECLKQLQGCFWVSLLLSLFLHTFLDLNMMLIKLTFSLTLKHIFALFHQTKFQINRFIAKTVLKFYLSNDLINDWLNFTFLRLLFILGEFSLIKVL